MMDSNLHHPLGNPNKYNHTHTQARYLMKIYRKKDFHLVSPKHTPTFLIAVCRSTTIDLTWANHKTQDLQPATKVQLDSHSSNHHPIITRLTPTKHLLIQLKDLDNTLFLYALQQHLLKNTSTTDSIETTTV
ncbi:hypothetical protein O181_019167 [Austropuccinia psidii MF-1]|uniref:Endonuclease/exonuclease/phosphatase domain-containing protein n=1 Tax=Austropuccinia psidii MF-1 TaxID=1389203 RepID=A0A9Q3C970_9BASI|nr:hypothetical protein [Austropuccinia psidii MF-1]